MKTTKSKKVRAVRAWIYKDHLTKRGRKLSDNAMQVMYGSLWHGIGKVKVVFKKPQNPMFIPILITFQLPTPKKTK